MKKIIATWASILLLGTISFSQEDKSGFSIGIDHGSSFGFFPSIRGNYGWNGKTDLTYYGIFWTNPSYAVSGTDAWLETGVGVSFTAMNDKLFLNPSLGFTHGVLLSGAKRGRIFEGIVPNVFALYNEGKFEAEGFMAYYAAVRDGGTKSNYILYWLYPGITITDKFSMGLHYEQFYLTGGGGQKAQSIHHWLGAYIKFTAQGKYIFRLTMGGNMENNGIVSKEYYRLSSVIPL